MLKFRIKKFLYSLTLVEAIIHTASAISPLNPDELENYHRTLADRPYMEILQGIGIDPADQQAVLAFVACMKAKIPMSGTEKDQDTLYSLSLIKELISSTHTSPISYAKVIEFLDNHTFGDSALNRWVDHIFKLLNNGQNPEVSRDVYLNNLGTWQKLKSLIKDEQKNELPQTLEDFRPPYVNIDNLFNELELKRQHDLPDYGNSHTGYSGHPHLQPHLFSAVPQQQTGLSPYNTPSTGQLGQQQPVLYPSLAELQTGSAPHSTLGTGQQQPVLYPPLQTPQYGGGYSPHGVPTHPSYPPSAPPLNREEIGAGNFSPTPESPYSGEQSQLLKNMEDAGNRVYTTTIRGASYVGEAARNLPGHAVNLGYSTANAASKITNATADVVNHGVTYAKNTAHNAVNAAADKTKQASSYFSSHLPTIPSFRSATATSAEDKMFGWDSTYDAERANEETMNRHTSSSSTPVSSGRETPRPDTPRPPKTTPGEEVDDDKSDTRSDDIDDNKSETSMASHRTIESNHKKMGNF